MAKSNIWNAISKISLGLVIVLVWGFLWVRADVFFPTNTLIWKINYLLTFMGLVTFVFAWDTVSPAKTEKELFRASFIKRFPTFLIAGTIAFIVLYIFGLLTSGGSYPTILGALSSVSLGVIIIHAFLIAIAEELVFRGWIPERLSGRGFKTSTVMMISTIIFATFHAGMGKSWLTLLTYIPLGMLFFQIKLKWSPRTNMANAGVHFAWNLFILGVIG